MTAVTLGGPAWAGVAVPPIEPVRVLPAPPPEAQENQDEWDRSLFTTGAVVFATSYGGAVVVAATSDHVGDNHLYIPLVGPWLDIVDRGSCPVGLPSCDSETSSKVLLVADAVFQAAGVVSMIDAAFVRVHHESAAEARRAYRKVRVSPTSYGWGAPGFAVSGHF